MNNQEVKRNNIIQIQPKASSDIIDYAKNVMSLESKAINRAADLIDENFSKAVNKILTSNSRLCLTGMGKAGIMPIKPKQH